MLEDMQILYLVLSALAGAAVASVLGWSQSTEPFDPKKFVYSLIRGAIVSVLFVVKSYFVVSEITAWDYLFAAIAAAGFDVGIKRTVGTVRALRARRYSRGHGPKPK